MKITVKIEFDVAKLLLLKTQGMRQKEVEAYLKSVVPSVLRELKRIEQEKES